MRLYRYLDATYGLRAIAERRLKISTIMELNDPFEFLGVNRSNRRVRWALRSTKRELSELQGLLCFSKTWNNPVLWGHYADRHRGLCLGFDVNRTFFRKVDYVDTRPDLPAEIDLRFMRHLFFTKFSHWSYEQEYRAFVSLQERENGLYFMNFSMDLVLKRVIVGDQSKVSRRQVLEALGPDLAQVEIFKARAAFQTFEVVRQRNEALWP